MERLGRFRVLVSTIVLRSVYRVDDRLSCSNRLSIRTPIVVDYQLQRWS
jgi:hypothetical protein